MEVRRVCHEEQRTTSQPGKSFSLQGPVKAVRHLNQEAHKSLSYFIRLHRASRNLVTKLSEFEKTRALSRAVESMAKVARG